MFDVGIGLTLVDFIPCSSSKFNQGLALCCVDEKCYCIIHEEDLVYWSREARKVQHVISPLLLMEDLRNFISVQSSDSDDFQIFVRTRVSISSASYSGYQVDNIISIIFIFELSYTA